MKRCPACNRTFEDTMTFCLVDGSILSAPFGPNARRGEAVPRSESTPTTMIYPPVNAPESPITASVKPTPPETIPAATLRAAISAERDTPHAGAHQTETPSQAVQAQLTSEPNQLPMKTIAAPAPQIGFRNPAISGAQSELRQTMPSARLDPTSQPVSAEGKPSGFLAIGGLVVVVILAGGLFWLIKHNKAADRPAPEAATQPAGTRGAKGAAPAASFTEIVNGSGMDMVFVRGGSYVMGSPASDPDRDQDEGPQTEVTVPTFHMSKYEITQGQYKAVMNSNPSSVREDDLPVDSVSWTDAVSFCRKLSELTEHQYRLPTEAEWEYAARAGLSESSAANVAAMAWYDANSAGHAHPVGQKQPNAFGLYDLNGNLWEWCQSKYRPYPYSGTDGRENLEGTDVRVLRGGSFETSVRGCRATYRRRVTPHPSASGFRVILIAW